MHLLNQANLIIKLPDFPYCLSMKAINYSVTSKSSA